ncbi:class I SAM-dependent methyltransferase [Rothia sp. AR01]|uniref:Class I SAM-dependent methyltransferase n=1 Tax=Rothia santali TaxID=2949643 RepID=A0A9X2KGH9_9MICC|nr:class I SAM-dependent methyltransferase [Rothia santali]MCP3424882.1 class I SAM-dependent methyltransferase [Rothia santali]
MPAEYTADELALLDGIEYREGDVLALSARLRDRGLGPERTADLLTQARLRGEAAAKFGAAEAARMLLTRDGLEQATRRAVARLHARRFREAGIGSVADLGCGLGGDSAAFAREGLRVLAVERDPRTAAFAAHNLAPHPAAEVRRADVAELDLGALADAAGRPVEALWLDPARREEPGSRRSPGGQARRIFDPEAFSPPFSLIEALARTGLPLGVKMGPGMDRAAIPAGAEAEWVSHRGEVVELVLWFNALRSPGVRRRATVLGPDPLEPEVLASLASGDDFGRGPEAPVGEPGAFLYEPDGAVIRAELVDRLAGATGGRLVDPRIAYVFSDEEHRLDWATGWRVLEALPLHAKPLKRWVREHGVTDLTIKKRGVDVVPEALRRQLLAGAKRGGGRGRRGPLVLTRWDAAEGERRGAFAVEPLGPAD